MHFFILHLVFFIFHFILLLAKWQLKLFALWTCLTQAVPPERRLHTGPFLEKARMLSSPSSGQGGAAGRKGRSERRLGAKKPQRSKNVYI